LHVTTSIIIRKNIKEERGRKKGRGKGELKTSALLLEHSLLPEQREKKNVEAAPKKINK
jgi:hypothetical protein